MAVAVGVAGVAAVGAYLRHWIMQDDGEQEQAPHHSTQNESVCCCLMQ